MGLGRKDSGRNIRLSGNEQQQQLVTYSDSARLFVYSLIYLSLVIHYLCRLVLGLYFLNCHSILNYFLRRIHFNCKISHEKTENRHLLENPGEETSQKTHL
jgi:hypothetical protein